MLDTRQADHARSVLRVEVGRRLRAGLVDGPTGEAEVLACGPDRVEVRFTPTGPPVGAGPDVLVVAVPRPKVLARVLRLAAELGVGALHLCRSWRVDPAYLASPGLTPAAIAPQLVLGAEQGGWTRLPQVTVHPRFMQMIDAVAVAGGQLLVAHRVVLHAGADVPVLERVAGSGGPTALAIGPEGGWIARELDTFAGAGFAPASLGPAVLKVETAIATGLAQVSLLRRLVDHRPS